MHAFSFKVSKYCILKNYLQLFLFFEKSFVNNKRAKMALNRSPEQVWGGGYEWQEANKFKAFHV